jgi:hypothetical protein
MHLHWPLATPTLAGDQHIATNSSGLPINTLWNGNQPGTPLIPYQQWPSDLKTST